MSSSQDWINTTVFFPPPENTGQINLPDSKESIRHWSDTFASDRYLIDVDPRVFAGTLSTLSVQQFYFISTGEVECITSINGTAMMTSWHTHDDVMSTLLALYEGNAPVTGGSPSQKSSYTIAIGCFLCCQPESYVKQTIKFLVSPWRSCDVQMATITIQQFRDLKKISLSIVLRHIDDKWIPMIWYQIIDSQQNFVRNTKICCLRYAIDDLPCTIGC